MMSQPAMDASLEAEFASVAESSGCELVHVDFDQGKLQVFLDRPEGVTIDDCKTVSKQISALLDVSDFGKKPYVLEVSSPGLDRPLYSPKDYERFLGSLVRMTFFTSEPRTKKTIIGRLESYLPGDSGDGKICLVESSPQTPHKAGAKPPKANAITETSERYEIRLADIVKARLEIEL